MEGLYNAWKNRASMQKYSAFAEALEAAYEKIDEYYQKTATSHAYTFAMRKIFIITASELVINIQRS